MAINSRKCTSPALRPFREVLLTNLVETWGEKMPKYLLNLYLVAGWWYTYPSEKYELVSWDYDMPN